MPARKLFCVLKNPCHRCNAPFLLLKVPLLRKAPAPDMWCVSCEASYLGGRRIGQPRSNPDGSREAMSGNGDPQPDSPLAYHASGDVAPSSGSSDASGDVPADDPTADPRL
jgi:hypothetical protein